MPGMFWGRGNRKDQLKRFRFQSAPLSTRLSPERHRQHTPRATRTRTRGGGAAFGVMNSPPRTQRTSSTARRSPGSGPRGRYKWMMAAYLWGEILADVCMTSFIFHCCAGEPPLIPTTPQSTAEPAKIGTVAEGSRRIACPTGAELGEVVNAVRSRDCRVSLVRTA